MSQHQIPNSVKTGIVVFFWLFLDIFCLFKGPKNHINKITNLSFYSYINLPKKHNHVEIIFENLKIIYNDPRRFGFFELVENNKKLKNRFQNLGPEPFNLNFDLNYVYNYFKGKKKLNENGVQTLLIFTTIGSLKSRLTGNNADLSDYGAIIVDEAHEHNTNMDLILTCARYSIYYNNDIRLVIISATMDDDEPIYRSYYKYINDNLLHPIKQELYNYNLNNNYFINQFHKISLGRNLINGKLFQI